MATFITVARFIGDDMTKARTNEEINADHIVRFRLEFKEKCEGCHDSFRATRIIFGDGSSIIVAETVNEVTTRVREEDLRLRVAAGRQVFNESV